MIGWMAALNGILQVVLLLLQAHYVKENDAKQSKADQAKAISDAIASGDASRLNSIIQQLRK